MRLALTIVIGLSALNLVILVSQLNFGDLEWRGVHIIRNSATLRTDIQWWPIGVRSDPVYPAAPVVYPRNDSYPNYVDDYKYYRQQGEIRALEERIGRAEQQRLWDNIYRDNR